MIGVSFWNKRQQTKSLTQRGANKNRAILISSTSAWSVPCSTLAPQCPHSDVELVQELVSFPSFEEKHNFAPGEEPGQRAPRPKRETSISAADEYSQAPFQQRRRQRLR